MMEDILGDDLPLPPARLFERLAQIPNYTWDRSVRLGKENAGGLADKDPVCAISLNLRSLVSLECKYP